MAIPAIDRIAREETLKTFSDRIGSHFKTEKISFTGVGNVFTKVRYGEMEPDKEEIEAVEEFLKNYNIYLKEKIGFFKMFFEEFKFLHFYQ